MGRKEHASLESKEFSDLDFVSEREPILVNGVISWLGNLPPPNVPPPRNKALLRAYSPLVSLNKALLSPYFWGGYVRGG